MSKLHEIKEYFKNAKIVHCATGNDNYINIKDNIIVDMHDCDGSIWITVKHENNNLDILLYSDWRELGGKYAEIIESVNECHVCGSYAKELYKCDRCSNAFCDNCQAPFTIHSQIDFPCCDTCYNDNDDY